ncbi:MAG: hypothetical protein DRJ01_15050 [Bacteroidetes bacterium]|nr:MAG: hypothetical protein DRJ01_15050 [Bacteroidota bacterium]
MASIPVSEITTSINETGMVMVYQFYNNINMALPMTATYDGYTKHIDYAYGVGEVAIIIKDSDLYTLSPSSDITYRIVIIEGSVMSRNTDVDFNNYQEVKTVFNLKD